MLRGSWVSVRRRDTLEGKDARTRGAVLSSFFEKSLVAGAIAPSVRDVLLLRRWDRAPFAFRALDRFLGFAAGETRGLSSTGPTFRGDPRGSLGGRVGRDSKAELAIIRRTTTTRRWVTHTVVVEDLVGTHPTGNVYRPSPGTETADIQRRRASDLAAAIEVTAGVRSPMADDRRQNPSPGRRQSDRDRISEEELTAQAIELRSYWAEQIGRPPHYLDERLKPMVIEFDLAQMKAFVDQVKEVCAGQGPRAHFEELKSLMRRKRYESKKKDPEP